MPCQRRLGADRPPLEIAAAVRTDAAQRTVGARAAEGAFQGADARLRAVRQVDAAALAVGAEFEGHQAVAWSWLLRMAGGYNGGGRGSTAFAHLWTLPREGTVRLVDRLNAYRSWWRPLPAWLKLVTAAGIYPAWFFLIYCVFTGASKSREALFAFGVFAAGALLHIAFDRRNRGGNPDRGGFDFFDGE